MDIYEITRMIGQNTLLYGGSFVLILSILVFVHEWGHYIIARLCGVRVETFSIGFGKEICGFNDKHGTRWKISMIPLGGYVKMFGDTDPASAGTTDEVQEGEEAPRPMTQAERQQAFFAKPVWKRAAVVVAGPAINYIFAIILLAGLYSFYGQAVTPPVSSAIISGSAAYEAGFEPHDKIISIDGVKINDFDDVRREMLIALDQRKHFVVLRGEETVDIYAAPKKEVEHDRFGFPHSKGVLGVIGPRNAFDITKITAINGEDITGLSDDEKRAEVSSRFGDVFTISLPMGGEVSTLKIQPFADNNTNYNTEDSPEYNLLFSTQGKVEAFVQHPIHVSLWEATKESWDMTRGSLEALGQMVVGTRSTQELGGIIRIGALAGDMAQKGWIAIIVFTALLSINLGFINLLPIPLLDGGHLLFYGFEAAMGKPIPEKVQEYAFRAGMVFLIGVMIFANINDLVQLFL